MTIINHWGHWVDSEKPTTGVIQLNHAPDWIFNEDGIDLSCLECEFHDGEGDECDFCESHSDWLIGTWKIDSDGKYSPDESGDYAAILRKDVIQIVFSKTTQRGALCSPCYPGQVDLDTPGEFLGFSLPEE